MKAAQGMHLDFGGTVLAFGPRAMRACIPWDE